MITKIFDTIKNKDNNKKNNDNKNKNSNKKSKANKNLTNYQTYSFSGQDLIGIVAAAMLFSGAVGWLFYDSLTAFLLLCAPTAYIQGRRRRETLCIRRKQQLEKEFRETILAVSADLEVGYSIENAFCEAYHDMLMFYGENSLMAQELHLLARRLANNDSLEDILLDLADRSGVQDIRDFVDIFGVAKRSGGNLKGMITNTANIIRDKAQVRQEITTVMSQKRMEQMMMKYLPFLMMGYLSVTSRGFFDPVYHNAAGIAIMTACLIVYAVACLLADKILQAAEME